MDAALNLPRITNEEKLRMDAESFAKFRKIKKFFDNKEYKTALKAINALIDSQTVAECSNLYLLAALCHSELREHDQAIEKCRKTLMKNLKKFEIWFIYASLFASAQNFDEAHKAFLQADQKDTEIVKKQFYTDWIFIAFQRNDMLTLASAASSLLKIDTVDQFAYSTLLLSYYRQGLYSMSMKLIQIVFSMTLDALATTRRSNILRPRFLHLLNLRFTILEKSQMYSKILQQFDDIKETKNDFNLPSYFEDRWKMISYIGKANYNKAQEHCTKLLESNPENIEAIQSFIRIRMDSYNSESRESMNSRTECLSELIKSLPSSNLAKSMFISEFNMSDQAKLQDDQLELFTDIIRMMVTNRNFGFFESLSSNFLQCPPKINVLSTIFNELKSKSGAHRLFVAQINLRYAQILKKSKSTISESIKQLEECIPTYDFNPDESNFSKNLISSAYHDINMKEKSLDLSNKLFQNEITSKYFAIKSAKHYLMNNEFDKSNEVLKYFSDSASNNVDDFYKRLNFEKLECYNIYYYMINNNFDKLLEICNRHADICIQYKIDLYDSLMYCCNMGTLLSIHEAHNAYPEFFRSKRTHFLLALGLKLVIVSIKDPQKFPINLKESAEKLGKKFLHSLFISACKQEITHRLAIEFYCLVGNKFAAYRSLNLLQCSSDLKSRICKKYEIDLNDPGQSNGIQSQMSTLMDKLMINSGSDCSTNEASLSSNVDLRNIWMLSDPFDDESDLQNNFLAGIHNDVDDCLQYDQKLILCIKLNKFLDII
ncbi:MAG: hypothetical protein MHMPM18_001665 [Marteilia pararefringens]